MSRFPRKDYPQQPLSQKAFVHLNHRRHIMPQEPPAGINSAAIGPIALLDQKPPAAETGMQDTWM
jgi:hypothetical protein